MSAQAWALLALIKTALEEDGPERVELHRLAAEKGIEDVAALRVFLDREPGDFATVYNVETRRSRRAA